MINVLLLANGQQIGSGKNGQPAIQSCTVTQSVNADRELTPGSACSACLEAKIITTDRRLSIPVGPDNSVILMREDGTQVGVFVPEQPVQLSANTYKLVAYDNVSRLDKDLSDWLKALDGWPYTLKTFAGMVAEACGVELVVEEIPNGSFNVQKFYQAGVTGRQILRWVGEMACRFLYADPEGRLRFGWYTDRGGQILPTGDDYYFAGALKYEDYKVAAVDAVKVRLSGTDGGLLWPDGAAENPYVVSGNPITLAKVDGSLPSHLGAILRELLALPEYRPCKVSVPADRDIRVGDIVTVQDIYGVRFRTLVMTRTVTGQRQTLECTGSMVRGSSTAANSKTPGQIAQEAVDRQSQKDIFNKLTDRGKAQGLFLGEDGNVYINASWISTGVLRSADDSVEVDLGNNCVTIYGERDGCKTELRLSSSGIEGYGENSEQEMEHTLSILVGVKGNPTGLWNESWQENTGLTLGSVAGEVFLGESTAAVKVFGSSVDIDSTLQDGVRVYGKTVSWRDNGDGTSTLIGT